jgi:hypothetical protein
LPGFLEVIPDNRIGNKLIQEMVGYCKNGARILERGGNHPDKWDNHRRRTNREEDIKKS